MVYKQISQHLYNCKKSNNNKRENKKEEPDLVKNEFKGYFNISSIIYDISLKNINISTTIIFYFLYFGINTKLLQPITVKIPKDNINKNFSAREIELLTLINNSNNNFPKFFNSYYIGDKLALIESLIGPNLKTMLKFCDGKFDIITVCHIGLELFDLLQIVHDYGYLYVDIKCDNINLIIKDFSKLENDYHICLTDFGFTCKYRNNEKEHLNPEDSRKR